MREVTEGYLNERPTLLRPGPCGYQVHGLSTLRYVLHRRGDDPLTLRPPDIGPTGIPPVLACESDQCD